MDAAAAVASVQLVVEDFFGEGNNEAKTRFEGALLLRLLLWEMVAAGGVPSPRPLSPAVAVAVDGTGRRGEKGGGTSTYCSCCCCGGGGGLLQAVMKACCCNR